MVPPIRGEAAMAANVTVYKGWELVATRDGAVWQVEIRPSGARTGHFQDSAGAINDAKAIVDHNFGPRRR
jgi:alpha/beta superfamily hydrolase